MEISPLTCEYGHEEYGTAAVRIAGYLAKPDSARACFGNKIYNNKIHIRTDDYPDELYTLMCWAFYYSARGGDNYVFGNDIVVEKSVPDSKSITGTFYICGGTGGFGGRCYNNHIITNIPAAWMSAFYGGAENSIIYNNTIVKSTTAGETFKPFRMGWKDCGECVAKHIEFRSNDISGASFDIETTGQDQNYTVYWNLLVKVINANGTP